MKINRSYLSLCFIITTAILTACSGNISNIKDDKLNSISLQIIDELSSNLKTAQASKRNTRTFTPKSSVSIDLTEEKINKLINFVLLEMANASLVSSSNLESILPKILEYSTQYIKNLQSLSDTQKQNIIQIILESIMKSIDERHEYTSNLDTLFEKISETLVLGIINGAGLSLENVSTVMKNITQIMTTSISYTGINSTQIDSTIQIMAQKAVSTCGSAFSAGSSAINENIQAISYGILKGTFSITIDGFDISNVPELTEKILTSMGQGINEIDDAQLEGASNKNQIIGNATSETLEALSSSTELQKQSVTYVYDLLAKVSSGALKACSSNCQEISSETSKALSSQFDNFTQIDSSNVASASQKVVEAMITTAFQTMLDTEVTAVTQGILQGSLEGLDEDDYSSTVIDQALEIMISETFSEAIANNLSATEVNAVAFSVYSGTMYVIDNSTNLDNQTYNAIVSASLTSATSGIVSTENLNNTIESANTVGGYALAINPPTVANFSASSLMEETESTITLNYTDLDGHLATTCTLSSLVNVTETTPCSCNTTGVCTVGITGTSNYNGAASFSYNVTTNAEVSNTANASLTILDVDDAPTISDITPTAFDEDVEEFIILSYEDTENDNATTCSVTNLTNVTESTACSCTDGTCTVGVTGTSNYNGTASFNYTVTANAAVSNTGSATLTLTAIDDSPVASDITPAAFNEDTQEIITLDYSDVEDHDATTCSLSNLTNVTESTACSCTDGICTVGVTGTSNTNGAASFNYTVTANAAVSNTGSATLTLTAIDDSPVASDITPAAFNEDTQEIITLDYSDVEDHDATTCSLSNLTNVTESTACSCTDGICTVGVTGTSNTNGAASFTYNVTANSALSNTATATLTISPVDDAPVSSDITPSNFNYNTQEIINLSYSDTESDKATTCTLANLTNITETQACDCDANGDCTVGVTGTADYLGAASFTYTITAAGNVSNSSSANLTIADLTAPTDPGSFIDGNIVLNTSTSTPQISWSASSDLTEVDYYQIKIGTTLGGNELLDWTNIGQGACTGTCTYTHSGLSFDLDTDYYISIRSVDTLGNLGTSVEGDGFNSRKWNKYVEGDQTVDATFVTLSPDGRNVYVASDADKSIAVYSIDQSDGSLTLVETETSVGTTGGPTALTASPDGLNIYAALNADDTLSVFTRDKTTGALAALETHIDGAAGVDGLDGINNMAVSPNGYSLYVSGADDNALAHFTRSYTTGELTFQAMSQDDAGVSIDGITGVTSLTVAPDGRNVYATGNGENAIAVFSRNLTSGILTYVEMKQDGLAGVDGLEGAYDVTVSPDRRHVYVASQTEDALAVFSRNLTSGELTYVEKIVDGLAGVDGLDGTMSVKLSPEGKYLYATGSVDNALVTFIRDQGDGTLTYYETLVDGLEGVDGLAGAESLALTSDGLYLYAIGPSEAASGSVSVFDIGLNELLANVDISYLEYHKDGTDGVDGLNGALAVAVSQDGLNVYVAGFDEDEVSVFTRDPGNNGTLSFLEIKSYNDPHDILASKDGLSVYVAYEYAVVHLSRNPATGALTEVAVITNATATKLSVTTNSKTAPAIANLAISPNDRDVYVVYQANDRISHFTRDLSTGELSYAVDDYYTSPDGGASVVVSPDGRFVYSTTWEGADQWYQYTRDRDTGLLTTTAVFDEQTAFGINTHPYGGLVYSPNWDYLYSPVVGGLLKISQNLTTGSLSANASYVYSMTSDCDSQHPSAFDINGINIYCITRLGYILAGQRDSSTNAITATQSIYQDDLSSMLLQPHGIAVSPDGENVYVADEYRDTLIVFKRD